MTAAEVADLTSARLVVRSPLAGKSSGAQVAPSHSRQCKDRRRHGPQGPDRRSAWRPQRKPCFVGTRIVVYDVLEYLASGMTQEEIVTDFPELTEAHVRVTLEFAASRERRLATPA